MNPNATAFYQVNNYLPQESVGYLMRRILSNMTQKIDRQLEPLDLTNAQWVPLLKLHLGQTFTVAELAREHQIDAGAMTRLLDRLEKKNLCTRARSEQDRRVVNLALTDKGREVAKTLGPLICDMQNESLAGFSQAEWQQLCQFLNRILDNVTVQNVAEEKP